MMPGFIDLPDTLKKYIPDFEYILADITKLDKLSNLKEEYQIVLETLSKARYESKDTIIDMFKKPYEYIRNQRIWIWLLTS